MEKNIYLFSGLLGLIVFLLMIFRYKKNRTTNIYFLVLMFLSSIRFIIHGISDVLISLLTFQKLIDLVLHLNAWPLIYMYFRKLVNKPEDFKKNDLLHFVAPTLFIFLIWFNNPFTIQSNRAISVIILICIITTYILYIITSFKLLKNEVWKRSNDLLFINQKNIIFKQWTYFLFILFVLMFLRFLIIYLMSYFEINYFNRIEFLWISALICSGVLLKMLYSPELIYGYHVFQEKIRDYNENIIVYKNIWTLKSLEISNIQDSILKNKMENNIENYILSIEKLALTSNVFYRENFNTTSLANELNIPKSHVLYIFKYHSKIKFSEFKKIVRIQKVINLIENGFLKKNKMEYLATEVGFTSYSSFFKSFISLTGVSPQDFLIRNNKNSSK